MTSRHRDSESGQRAFLRRILTEGSHRLEVSLSGDTVSGWHGRTIGAACLAGDDLLAPATAAQVHDVFAGVLDPTLSRRPCVCSHGPADAARREALAVLLTRLTARDLPLGWPAALPPVTHLAEQGLMLTAPVAFLIARGERVGEVDGGRGHRRCVRHQLRGRQGGTKYSSIGELTPLGEVLDAGLTTTGLRLLHGPRTRAARVLLPRRNTVQPRTERFRDARILGRRSYGAVPRRGVFTVLERMVSGPGLYLMDEPEAALSFQSCVRLVALMNRVAGEGGQIVCATHSPILASLPGAQIIELSEDGMHPAEWENLQLVDHWRRLMAKPDFYLRYALDARLRAAACR